MGLTGYTDKELELLDWLLAEFDPSLDNYYIRKAIHTEKNKRKQVKMTDKAPLKDTLKEFDLEQLGVVQKFLNGISAPSVTTTDELRDAIDKEYLERKERDHAVVELTQTIDNLRSRGSSNWIAAQLYDAGWRLNK